MFKLKPLICKYKVLPHYLVIALLILIVFVKLSFFEFLEWDDNQNILNNPDVRNFNFINIWTREYYGMYVPLASTLWAVLFKIEIQGFSIFHLFNIVIHIINSILVFKICKFLVEKFTDNSPNAFNYMALLATLFFSVHPLQVEAVAWVSGARDLIGTLFALASIYVFISHKSLISKFVLILLLILGLLAKPSIVIVPIILFFYDFMLNKNTLALAVLRVAPYLFISCVFVYIANDIQFDQIQKMLPTLSVFSRMQIALETVNFYLLKLVAPVYLSADYGLTPNFILNNASIFATLASIILYSSVYSYYYFNFNKLKLFGLVVALISILPTAGILPFAFQIVSTVADRYFYLAMLGVSIFLSTLAYNKFVNYFLIATLIIFCILSYRRIDIWENDRIFFSAMLESNKNSYNANIGLGYEQLNKKKYLLASDYFKSAIKIQPDRAEGYADLSLALAHLEKFSEVQMLSKMLLNDQNFLERNFGTSGLSQFYSTVAFSELKLNNPEISFKFFCQALVHNPENSDAKINIPIVQNIFKKQTNRNLVCTSSAAK